MRALLVSLTLLLGLGLVSLAQAENRMFIVGNDSGYGVDRCLASGATCGTAGANAYCKAQNFAQARSFRKVDRDDITGAIPAGGANRCTGANCEDIVAIVCTR